MYNQVHVSVPDYFSRYGNDLMVHYGPSDVVVGNKLCEGPKHLMTQMRILD